MSGRKVRQQSKRRLGPIVTAALPEQPLLDYLERLAVPEIAAGFTPEQISTFAALALKGYHDGVRGGS